MQKLLIVDAEQSANHSLSSLLERNDFEVISVQSVQEANEKLSRNSFDLIISDLRLPGQPGSDLLQMTTTPVLLMSTFVCTGSAIDNTNLPPIEYLSKPVKEDALLESIQLKLKLNSTAPKTITPSETDCQAASGMVGKSVGMCELFRRIGKVAMTDSAVLIQGECGTGKELVAKAVHEGSVRSSGKLVSVNCAAIPENLIESELFGHEKGAFNGANEDRTGLVEEANNGTLFLDEISELPLEAQARLLRVLHEHEIRKVGSVHSQQVDIRLVAATHQNLQQIVNDGKFREDLFYRINVMTLNIPPLRNRGADILELANTKLKQCCDRLELEVKHFSVDCLQAITTYSWPGNVRELENVIEQAVVLTEGKEISLAVLGLDVELVSSENFLANKSSQNAVNSEGHLTGKPVSARELSLKDYFQGFVLEHQGHLNETELAKKLGISRKCLWERRQRFDIPRKKKSA
ncbi:MAG: sigma-54 dependent transcriptional regulator [Gammaproteobacteria bacterium]|nr:sigma-54 dependent transcriptional regulator [Gammaproteobacteria bacterium]